MASNCHSILTSARQAEIDAASLCVTMAASAVSIHKSDVAVRKCGMTIGAIRMSAPLPADATPDSYHGFPDFKLKMNPWTVPPMP